jgi:cell division protein FtsW (lipid II flippase)
MPADRRAPRTGTAPPRGKGPVARRRRRTELALMIMGGVVTSLAYLLASLGRNAEIPARIGPFLGVLLGLLLGAHLANRVLAPGADSLLLPLAAALHGIGFVMITRLSDRLSGLQATWSLVGVGVFVATLLFVPRVGDLAKYRWTLFFGGTALLLLPLVPGIGFSSGGARIWVSIGPVNFQPGEFAKVGLALFFASYLAERGSNIAANTWSVAGLRLPEPADLLPLLMAWGFSVVVMVFQRDLGSSLLFFSLFVVVTWIATERASYLALGAALFLGGATIAYQLFGHVQDRVAIWLDPWSDYADKGYQLAQAAFAFAGGGITGTGLGLGDPQRIPLAQNDFIFAAIGEELGLLGATAVLAAYVLMVGSGLRIAVRSERTFDKLLAVGLTTIIALQAFLIVGGVIRLLPLTGVTLPFVSYGGSSLVANYIALALLVRISDSTAKRLGEVPDGPTWNERLAARRAARRERRAA